MNDSYEWECVRSTHEPSQSALDETEGTLAREHGVLCFSRSWNNILMWSHYADRHKGICLGFDVPSEPERTIEVRYVGNVQVVGNLRAVSEEEMVRIVDRLNCAKYRGWCYEEEVRIKATREEMDEETRQYFVNFSEHLKLKEVIAGARFPMSKRPIEDALNGYSEDVRIVKACRCTTRFEIIVDEHGFSA